MGSPPPPRTVCSYNPVILCNVFQCHPLPLQSRHPPRHTSYSYVLCCQINKNTKCHTNTSHAHVRDEYMPPTVFRRLTAADAHTIFRFLPYNNNCLSSKPGVHNNNNLYTNIVELFVRQKLRGRRTIHWQYYIVIHQRGDVMMYMVILYWYLFRAYCSELFMEIILIEAALPLFIDRKNFGQHGGI